MTNERALWLAVLEQSISDLVHPEACSLTERPMIRRDTELWFQSDRRYTGSFRWICDTLDLDASWFRRKLLATTGALPDSSRPQFWHLPIIKKSRSMTGTRTATIGLTISP